MNQNTNPSLTDLATAIFDFILEVIIITPIVFAVGYAVILIVGTTLELLNN